MEEVPPGFERYQPRHWRQTDEPKVNIQRTGLIKLNIAAFMALGEPEAVELLFNRTEQMVAMRPVDVKARTGVRVRRLSGTTARGVTGNGFFRSFGVIPATPITSTADIFGSMLVFRLDSP